MVTDKRTQRSLGSAWIISRRRFLKQTAMATAVASVPYLAARSAAFGKEQAKSADAALDRALKDLVAMEGGPPGVIAVVQRGQHRKVHTFGVRNIKSGLPIRVDDRMRIASVAKAFSGAVALSLVSEGKLSLHDTIGKWLRELLPEAWWEVTLRQLLNHTSGIFNYFDDEAFTQSLLAHPLQAHTPHELVAVATAHPPVFAPGTSWSYSNTNYIVIGLILERVTHRSVSSLLRQRIIRPLRLHDTMYPTRSPNIPGYHAHGYLPPTLSDLFPPPWGGQNRYVDISRFSPTVTGAEGALISNPDDLRRFYRALLSGQLLRPAQLAKMKTMVELDPGFGYGLGLATTETPCGRIWGHNGSVPGYTTIAWNDESGRRGMVVGLPTEQDEAIAAAFDTVLATAACRVFGRPVGSTAAGVTAAGAVGVLPRVDHGLLAARAG